MRLLVLDPSGNFDKDKGTTGIACFVNGVLEHFTHIKAENYRAAEEYWASVGNYMRVFEPDKVVCESFKLFGHKAKQQTGSSLETSQLIGYLRMVCYLDSVKWIFQDPKDKNRFADPILVHEGVLELRNGRYYALGKQTVIHERDAIRHGVWHLKYGKG